MFGALLPVGVGCFYPPKKKGEEAAMRIRECLDPTRIHVGVELVDKDAVLRFVAGKAAAYLKGDEGLLLQGFREREMSFTTGIGLGIALPHTTSVSCKKTTLFLARLKHPIDFEAIDELPVDLVLALVIPESRPSEHVQILARTARLCKERAFPQALRQAGDTSLIWETVNTLEKEAEVAWYGEEG